MATVVEIGSPDQTQRIRRVQFLTIGWMLVEVVVSLFSAWRARSPALFAFGGDSVIELGSAVVVQWRFRSGSACETKESRAARIAGALLCVLAACVAVRRSSSCLSSSGKAVRQCAAKLVAVTDNVTWAASVEMRTKV
jgi:hypothetical protein